MLLKSPQAGCRCLWSPLACRAGWGSWSLCTARGAQKNLHLRSFSSREKYTGILSPAVVAKEPPTHALQRPGKRPNIARPPRAAAVSNGSESLPASDLINPSPIPSTPHTPPAPFDTAATNSSSTPTQPQPPQPASRRPGTPAPQPLASNSSGGAADASAPRPARGRKAASQPRRKPSPSEAPEQPPRRPSKRRKVSATLPPGPTSSPDACKQTTAFIMSCTNWRQLAEVHSKHRAALNPVHVSAMLTQISKVVPHYR